MNDKIKSALKLIVSLAIGVLLIWYFYNQISASKTATIDAKKFPNIGSIQKIVVPVNTYCLVGDTLLYYNEGIPYLAETEAFYSLQSAITRDDKNNYIIGQYRIDIMTIMKKVFSNASIFWLSIMLLVSLMSHVLRSLRWRMMLEPLGYKPKAYNTFFAVMIMYMANMALPRLGEVLRCTFISRYEKIPVEKSIGTMISERVIDTLSLLILGIIMLATQYKIIFAYFDNEYLANAQSKSLFSSGNIVLAVIATMVLSALAYFLYKYLRNSDSQLVIKIKRIVKGLIDGIVSVKNVKNKPLFLLYTISIWICYTMTIFLCFKAVPETSMHGLGAAVTCMFFGSISLIAVQGGLGIYPIVVSKILFLYGTSESIGYAYGWLSWVVQTVLVLIVGFLSVILMANLNKEPVSK